MVTERTQWVESERTARNRRRRRQKFRPTQKAPARGQHRRSRDRNECASQLDCARADEFSPHGRSMSAQSGEDTPHPPIVHRNACVIRAKPIVMEDLVMRIGEIRGWFAGNLPPKVPRLRGERLHSVVDFPFAVCAGDHATVPLKSTRGCTAPSQRRMTREEPCVPRRLPFDIAGERARSPGTTCHIWRWPSDPGTDPHGTDVHRGPRGSVRSACAQWCPPQSVAGGHAPPPRTGSR